MASWRTSRGTLLSLPAQTPAASSAPDTDTPGSRQDNSTASKNGTPYSTLKQLANIPKPSTPLRRASSAGPPSTRRSAHRYPTGIQRPLSARRPAALTPHAKAALRENDLRRQAALTPGKERWRSGRQQRETPRDVLRQLSRVLATKSTRPEVSPEISKAVDGKITLVGDDFEDGPALVRPRPSLPLGVDEDDDSYLLPPKSAGLMQDDDYTAHSIELPRRAVSERPGGRYSRGSFGSIRMSDGFELETGLENLGSDGIDPSYVRNFDESDFDAADRSNILRENTADLRGAFLDDNIPRLSGRISDIRAGAILDDDTENSFVLNIPQRRITLGDEAAANESSIMYRDGESSFQFLEAGDERPREDLEPEDPSQIHEVIESYLETEEGDTIMPDTSVVVPEYLEATKKRIKSKKTVRVSKHGTQYPTLPPGIVKKLATTYLRTSGNVKAKISKASLDALMQATDWFFEQVSDDLGAYANHAGRKTIDESDVIALMKRQRQTSSQMTPFALAQKYLPRELLQDMRMAPPSKLRAGHYLARVEEDDEDDDG